MRTVIENDRQKYETLRGVKMLPTYDIQGRYINLIMHVQYNGFLFYLGREFQALFLGTVEQTDCNGMTCNPTKSICNPFVFNTAITRAQSLVVSVGNPFVLLKMERHSENKCWTRYLQFCAMHDTLTISDSFHDDEAVQKLQMLKDMVSNATSFIPPIPQENFQPGKLKLSNVY